MTSYSLPGAPVNFSRELEIASSESPLAEAMATAISKFSRLCLPKIEIFPEIEFPSLLKILTSYPPPLLWKRSKYQSDLSEIESDFASILISLIRRLPKSLSTFM